MMAGEIVGLEEKADAATRLVADCRALRLAVRLGEQQASTGIGRGRHHEPALSVAKRLIR
ncbi:hypothetical protein D3C72_2521810 [compost metagenome]